MRTGSLACLVGQGESVNLMACSLCRCHLVIIPRQPSAGRSCRTRPLSLLGPGWLAGSMLLSLPFWPATPPASSQNAWPVRARGGRQRTHTERQKGKLWTLCHNVNWDKLMMDPHFPAGSPHSWLLGFSPSSLLGCRYTAKINSWIHSRCFTCQWFYPKKWLTW